MGWISEGLDIKLVALHKHWVTADSVQHHLRRSIESGGQTMKGAPADVVAMAQAHSTFLALSVWYGLVYVVIEGYQELKLQDEAIDALLADTTRVSTLRRFRNGVFHYQGDPISDKILDFITASDSEIWIRDMNRALKRSSSANSSLTRRSRPWAWSAKTRPDRTGAPSGCWRGSGAC